MLLYGSVLTSKGKHGKIIGSFRCLSVRICINVKNLYLRKARRCAGVGNKTVCSGFQSLEVLKYTNFYNAINRHNNYKSCFNTNCANRNFIGCRPRNLKVTKKIVLIAQLIRKIWKSYFSRQTIDVIKPSKTTTHCS